MNKSVLAALQLFQYGLTPLPLIGKKPILIDWPNRFIEKPIQQLEIIKGIVEPNGNVINFDNKNIGIITGAISNSIVLDIDDLSLLPKLEKMGTLPLTWQVRSNRGIHLYFNYNENVPSMKLWDNIDVLSNKKQVVAPPSVHPNGTLYQWVNSPKKIQKADLPLWLVDYLIDYKSQTNCNKSSAKKTNSSSVYKKRNKFKSNEIKNLLENVDWVNFYSRFTNNIRGHGDWLSSKCPFHKDQHNSFSFNKSNGAWICFAGCGSGNGITAVQFIYNINFRQAIQVIKGEDLIV